MARKQKYQIGESVLCYQGPLIYEAKIQAIKTEGTNVLYDIHYKGWNKTWDEFVLEDRLMKVNEENLKKQKTVESEVKSKKKFAAKKTGATVLKRSNSDSPEDECSSREASKDRDNPRLAHPKKKFRSRSNSDASVVSMTSCKSIESKISESKSESSKVDTKKMKNLQTVIDDDSVELVSRRRTRTVKPLAVLKTATEVPKASKKYKKKKGDKSQTQVKAITLIKNSNPKTFTKTTKSTSKPKAKKSSNTVQDKSLNKNKRKFGQEIVIPLSDELKAALVDDFDYIGRQRKLLHVPSRYTVDDLINAYYEARKCIDGATEEQLLGAEEVCRGLKDYFNSTLGSQLLYKFERVQYADTLKENIGIPMAQLYGPVHLLRLLTKLGPMLSAANIDEESLDKLVAHVTDFIEYMQKHRETLFQIDDYGTATPEYHRRAL